MAIAATFNLGITVLDVTADQHDDLIEFSCDAAGIILVVTDSAEGRDQLTSIESFQFTDTQGDRLFA